jgi:outer membrane protein OmpA-like peptidoglycan-associated protein
MDFTGLPLSMTYQLRRHFMKNMMQNVALRKAFLLIALISFGFQLGCTGLVYAPKRGIWYYPPDLPEADKAVAVAAKSGKDKECPDEFKEAAKMKEEAYDVYLSCRDKEAIALAKAAAEKVNALCPKKPAQEPAGKSASETPATGQEKPSPKVIDRMTVMVNFDFDKSAIRKKDKEELEKAVEFLKKYPGARIVIEGHTCSIGTEKYNQGLSERRADSVKKYLVGRGVVEKEKVSTVGYGEMKPAATNKTREDRVKNRRAEILIMSE